MIYKKYTYTYRNVLNGTVYIIKVFGLSFFLFFTLRDGFKFVYIYSSNIEISGVDGGQSVGRVGEGVWSGYQDLLGKKDAPHPQHFVSLRIISFWINRDCTLQEVQLSLSAMLKGGYKAIDFSEDNIFLLFSLRFRGYETHHKTPLLIYLWIKTVLKKKNNQNRNLGFKSNLGVYRTQFGSRCGVLVFLVFIPQWKVKITL